MNSNFNTHTKQYANTGDETVPTTTNGFDGVSNYGNVVALHGPADANLPENQVVRYIPDVLPDVTTTDHYYVDWAVGEPADGLIPIVSGTNNTADPNNTDYNLEVPNVQNLLQQYQEAVDTKARELFIDTANHDVSSDTGLKYMIQVPILQWAQIGLNPSTTTEYTTVLVTSRSGIITWNAMYIIDKDNPLLPTSEGVKDGNKVSYTIMSSDPNTKDPSTRDQYQAHFRSEYIIGAVTSSNRVRLCSDDGRDRDVDLYQTQVQDRGVWFYKFAFVYTDSPSSVPDPLHPLYQTDLSFATVDLTASITKRDEVKVLTVLYKDTFYKLYYRVHEEDESHVANYVLALSVHTANGEDETYAKNNSVRLSRYLTDVFNVSSGVAADSLYVIKATVKDASVAGNERIFHMLHSTSTS